MASEQPTRSRRIRSRRILALTLLLAAGGSAAAAGAMLGADERGATEERSPGASASAGSFDGSRAPPPLDGGPDSDRESREPPRRSAKADSDKPRIDWRRSRAVGLPSAGSLERGVKLPFGGANYFTWDPIQKESPNRGWRRWGTDRLVRTTLRVVREFAAAHPKAPRIGIGDLGRPNGGDFGPRYGLPGHASHQNGLDVDLYYPRLDRREAAPLGPDQIDRGLSQDLVDRFVRAGAEVIFVGPSTGLGGPPGVVVPLINHDNHLHVRLPG